MEGDVAVGVEDGVLVRDVGGWSLGWLGLGLGVMVVVTDLEIRMLIGRMWMRTE